MRQKPYYSVRIGINPLVKNFDLEALRGLFKHLFQRFDASGYFQEAFGYHCVDSGFVPGTLGQDMEGVLLLELRKQNLTPIHRKIAEYSEDDLFDIIEFIYDHVSKPSENNGYYHEYNACGWHYSEFQKEQGQDEYRKEINKLLVFYKNGFELSLDGQILNLVSDGLDALFEAPLPHVDPENVEKRVEIAKTKFRRSRASLDERLDAVRDLASVLEYLREDLSKNLTRKDESDLFELANRFGIRHHNEKQKTDYDKIIWYDWMFYYYLATINASMNLIKRDGQVIDGSF